MRTAARAATATAGALLFRLPFWIIAWLALPTLCNWDCGIYANISRHYVASNAAFFPLFPLLIHGVSRLLPLLSPEASVVLTSNFFVPVAGVLFLFLADSLWERRLVRGSGGPGGPGPGAKRFAGFYRQSWLALLLLSVFPEGHFWMRGYSEPLFFALLIAILLGLSRKSWLLTGACCGLIAVTRPQGIWVDAVVGPYLLWRLFAKENGSARVLIAVVLCALPLLGFMAWLWSRTGNPLYFYIAQHGWGRSLDLMGGLKAQLPHWDASHLYLYLGLWAAVRFLRRPSLEWRMLGILSLVLSELPIFFGGFYSYVRFASVNPALFVLGSELISATGWAMNGVTLAVVVWWVIRLALQVHLAGSTWVG